MGKRGKILAVIGVVFLILIGIAGIAGIYFYNFHVFKTMRLCISENSRDSGIECSSNDDCVQSIKENLTLMNNELENLPEFAEKKFDELIVKTTYCNSTCYIKNIGGLEEMFQKEERFEIECASGEEEFVVEIRGKEGLEILKYMQEQKNNLD